MKDTLISRREFLKDIGMIGAGVLLSASPWLSAFSEVVETSGEKCRLAIIGPGSRGRFLMSFLVQNPKVEIVALCDIYQPSIEKALELAPKAKVYDDYREILEDKTVDAVLVATPLNSHCQIVLDAFDAGKHVFCEKSIGFTMEECFRIYNKHISTEKVFFTGQQRLFDPRYIKAMEMIHAGTFGEINAIRTFWNRNGDWRREVPSPDLERLINWRLYREYSKGLMTELACHQLQIGSWALQKLPEKVIRIGTVLFIWLLSCAESGWSVRYGYFPFFLAITVLLGFCQKHMKKLRLVCLALGSMIFLSSCGAVEPEKRLYPLAVAFDYMSEEATAPENSETGEETGTAVSESGGEKETAGGKWRVWYAPANLAVVTGQGKDEQEEGTDEDPASLFFEAETFEEIAQQYDSTEEYDEHRRRTKRAT